jgi:hypothetical protein
VSPPLRQPRLYDASEQRVHLAKGGTKVIGRYRWAQRAWLARQQGLRDGVTTVALAPRWREGVAARATADSD